MSEFCFPFDDTEYTAQQWRQYTNSIYTSGICPAYNGETSGVLAVSIGNGLTVNIGAGCAIVNGINYVNSVSKPITLPSNNIDCIYDIVIEVDIINSVCTAKHKVRTSGLSIESDLIRNDIIYQIALASIEYTANSTIITPVMITDQRYNSKLCSDGKAVCGISTPFEKIDTSVMISAFEYWFNNVKATLSGDVAGNIQNQINEITSGTTPVGNSEKLGGYASKEFVKQNVYVATSTDGISYTLTIPDIDLEIGTLICVSTTTNNTVTNPTLNVNNTGAKPIMRNKSHQNTWLPANITVGMFRNIPILLKYNSDAWIAVEFTQPYANDLADVMQITKGGTGQTTLADTTYTTARYRGSALVSTETTPTVNGVINLQYE